MKLLGNFLLIFLFLFSTQVKGELSECSFAKTIQFIDQQRRCTSDYPELEAASKRGKNWVSSRGLYSIAIPLGSDSCPPAIGVGSNNNSEFNIYSEQRDVNAVDQCKQQLNATTIPAGMPCACRVIIKDGIASIDRKVFESALVAWRMHFMADPARRKTENIDAQDYKQEAEPRQRPGFRQKPQNQRIESKIPSK